MLSLPALIIIDTITLVIIFLTIVMMWETRHPVIDYVELRTPDHATSRKKTFVKRDIYVRQADLEHPERCSSRVLFFSDLHAEYCFYKAEDLAKLIETENAKSGLDAVIFGGDIVNLPDNFEVGKTYINTISETCKKLNIPFVGVTGNHDALLTDSQIEECNFTYLKNRYITLPNKTGDGVIAISGVGDSGKYNRVWDNPAQVPEEVMGQKVKAHVLVSHNPDYILHLDKCFQSGVPATHVLAGHIHGGQIRTPIRVEFNILRKDILPRKYNVIAGVYAGFGVSLFLSRGLGNVFLPFRLGSRPEISIVEIYE